MSDELKAKARETAMRAQYAWEEGSKTLVDTMVAEFLPFLRAERERAIRAESELAELKAAQ